jgi:hypothetical protein
MSIYLSAVVNLVQRERELAVDFVFHDGKVPGEW